MSSNDIYAILSSKSSNDHMIRRYIKFIDHMKCRPSIEGYQEQHHICPKASSLFPEYSDLAQHEWNAVTLSAREHIIARRNLLSYRMM